MSKRDPWLPTGVPNVFERRGRYLVRWEYRGRRRSRTFGDLEEAVAFKEERTVAAGRDKLGRPRGGGLSHDPEKAARSLGNLAHSTEQLRQAALGNNYGVVHGGRSVSLVADVEAEVLELMEALGESAPVKDHGRLPPADVVAVERAARALKRWRHLSKWCDAHGRLREKTGEVKPAAEYELKAERELTAALESMGMTPAARARLGVDLVRGMTAAQRLDEHLRENYGGDVVDGREAKA